MKTITVCKCGSPRVFRDAQINANTGEVNDYCDDLTCADCGYDGMYFDNVEVSDDFDLDNGFYRGGCP